MMRSNSRRADYASAAKWPRWTTRGDLSALGRGSSRGAELAGPTRSYLSSFVDLAAASVRVVFARSADDLQGMDESTTALVNLCRVNDIRWVNRFFLAAHGVLPDGGLLVVNFETLQQRRIRIRRKYPSWFATPYYLATFVFHRVFSKLPLVKRGYFAFTRGRNRPLSKAEVLGRLCYCGFEILDGRTLGRRRYVIARRSSKPAVNARPSYGPFFAMSRVGMNGRLIRVYKFRTMHPYSEYLQEYVYRHHHLADGGKLRRDYRVTVWGQWMRRLWIDELPMVVNWIRRDLKLVGVRPLSEHYESLYPEDLRERRRRVRPGLIPPFYADLPRTFEEILASEDRYLRRYEEHPLATDMRYLARALGNIIIRRARSR